MTGKICKGCETQIPRKKPHSNKKTSKNRKYCYNCSPLKSYRPKDHESHLEERRRRKEILVKMLGGRCANCGYDKSIRALSFHHLCPDDKLFDVSNGHIMSEWNTVIEEAKKCELLCLNCHAEEHESDKENN